MRRHGLSRAHDVVADLHVLRAKRMRMISGGSRNVSLSAPRPWASAAAHRTSTRPVRIDLVQLGQHLARYSGCRSSSINIHALVPSGVWPANIIEMKMPVTRPG